MKDSCPRMSSADRLLAKLTRDWATRLDNGIETNQPKRAAALFHSHPEETKRLFSDLINKCGDPTCAQRGSPDDPNVLLVKKAVDSINNRRATWLRVRAKAKARGETGWIDPEPEPRGPKRGKGMPTAYQLLGKDEWPITELAEEIDDLSRGLPGGQPAGPPTGAGARAAP